MSKVCGTTCTLIINLLSFYIAPYNGLQDDVLQYAANQTGNTGASPPFFFYLHYTTHGPTTLGPVQRTKIKIVWLQKFSNLWFLFSCRKKKNAAVSLDDSITGHSSTQNTSLDTTQSRSPEKEPTTENGKAFPSVDLAQYRTHFRELDIEVFNILGCGQVSRRVVDSDLHTQVGSTLLFQTNRTRL